MYELLLFSSSENKKQQGNNVSSSQILLPWVETSIHTLILCHTTLLEANLSPALQPSGVNKLLWY